MKMNMYSGAYDRSDRRGTSCGLGRVTYEQMRNARTSHPLYRSNSLGGSCPLSGGRGKNRCGDTDARADAHDLKNEQNPVTAQEIPENNGGCGCGCGDHANDCAKLKKQLQTVDFALYEIILYLDAYPEDCEALNTYHMLLARRKKLACEYETLCGPLTAWGNVSTTSWDWVKGPSPWEYPYD
ncbi:MAG: spore coat protein CotJB [Clostridia bacterium]|nr:spore coat protein CotJB [Clostridia bacterium]